MQSRRLYAVLHLPWRGPGGVLLHAASLPSRRQPPSSHPAGLRLQSSGRSNRRVPVAVWQLEVVAATGGSGGVGFSREWMKAAAAGAGTMPAGAVGGGGGGCGTSSGKLTAAAALLSAVWLVVMNLPQNEWMGCAVLPVTEVKSCCCEVKRDEGHPVDLIRPASGSIRALPASTSSSVVVKQDAILQCSDLG